MFDKRIIKTKPAEMNVLRLKFTKKASFERNSSDRNITHCIKDIDALYLYPSANTGFRISCYTSIAQVFVYICFNSDLKSKQSCKRLN